MNALNDIVTNNKGLEKPRDRGPDPNSPDKEKEPLSLLNLGGDLNEIIQDPTSLEVVNRVIKNEVTRDGRIPILEDIDFKLKTFDEVNDDNDFDLGFEYSYDKNIRNEELSTNNVSDYLEYNLDLSSRGTIAFDRSRNFADFLETNLDFGFFGSWGGVQEAMSATEQTAFQTRYNSLLNDLTKIRDEKELLTSEKYKELISMARSKLTNQVALQAGARFGYETDQAFSNKQLVYGGELGVAFSGWEKFDQRTWGTISTAAKFNIFDYPFAAIRWATRLDEGFAPRSLSFPSARIGIELVDPIDNDPRADFGDNTTFPRFHLELSFKTPLFEFPEDGLFGEGILNLVGLVYFDVNFRYYQEIGATSEVKSANLDDPTYLVLTVAGTNGPFISYAHGRLPFDRKNDQVYQLGYKFHF
ncbi:MAG: hypothetical protein K0U54_12610 [Bacteroidetes bacterium]|nr:hypothetical protein [Bacteroidota bacterium]